MKSNVELNDFALKFRLQRRLCDGDPFDFISHISGYLRLYNEKTSAFDIKAGRVYAYRIEIEHAVEMNASVVEIFDSHNDELTDYYATLFDEHDDFQKKLEQFAEPGIGGNLLIVDRVEISEKFRGMNLGLICALRTIESFSGGCTYTALRPFPLQFGPYRRKPEKLRKLGYEQFAKTESQAFKNLRNYWSQIGFVRVGDSPVFIKSPIVGFINAESLFKPRNINAAKSC